jgi:hypothetical protein
MKQRVVWVSVTTGDGELLDRFPVCHWRTELEDDDQENVGSPAARSLLSERIQRYVAAEGDSLEQSLAILGTPTDGSDAQEHARAEAAIAALEVKP